VYVARATGQHLAKIQDQLEPLGVNLHYLIDGAELIEGLRYRNYPEISSIKATVTENTFTQNHNANTLELLQLITALRDTTA
jgi:hypothetical protein